MTISGRGAPADAATSAAATDTGVAFLFAPGAGAGSSSPWMQAWARRLATLAPVTTFDYPYRLAGRKSPDRPDVLVRAHAEALLGARRDDLEAAAGTARATPRRWYLVGKSMGSRMGCHVAVTHPGLVEGIVCLGYPLVAAGGGAVRDQVLLELAVPVLFVQGTRDPLCPLVLLRSVCARMTAPSRILEISGANHSLETARKKTNPAAQDAADTRILAEIRRFVAPSPDGW